jgi:hypothetical protein
MTRSPDSGLHGLAASLPTMIGHDKDFYATTFELA